MIANTPSLASYWMPFTANRPFSQAPRMLVEAQGMYYTNDDGRQILDGTAGLWCVNAGHGRAEIADAVSHQLRGRVTADIIAPSPPLIVNPAEIEAMVARLGEALNCVA